MTAEKACLRPATEQDAAYLAPRLRFADRREIRAASGLDPYTDLLVGIELSYPHAWVMADVTTNLPFLMGGVRPLSTNGIGLVWFLASPEIVSYARDVQRMTKEMLRSLFLAEGYLTVGNFVDVRNHRAVRWLYRMGFVFLDLNVPSGVKGELFHLFAMSKEQYLKRTEAADV